jgi:hypothetical protein
MFSLATRLALLVAGTTLPMILFAAGVIYLNHMHERQAAFDRVLDTVRGIRLVIDAEMQGITSGLEVLAASQSLACGDLDAFRRSAEAFLGRFPEGAAISLATCDGQQLLNTGAAAGEPLPLRVNRTSIEEVFRTGRPAYSSQQEEAKVETVSLEGVPLLTAFTRSPLM